MLYSSTPEQQKGIDVFVITKEWFNANRDCLSGLNRAQAEAIGEKYPLKKGWRTRVLGEVISEEQKIAFEQAKGLVQAVRKKLNEGAKQKKILTSHKENLELQLQIAKLQKEIKRIKKKT